MKLKVIHLWVLTSALVIYVDLIHGLIVILATLTILAQDKMLGIMRSLQSKSNTKSK